MNPCEKVGLDFVDTAPYRFSNTVDLNVTPDQLWEVFVDAAAWPRWAKVITNVTWTSPEPFGIGTTRTVEMVGGLVGSEEFLAWEPGTLLAFRFNEASETVIRAFAERYDIVSTPNGCRLTWTLALDVTGPARFTMPPGRPLLNLGFRWFLRNLRRYTDERYSS